MGLSGIPLAAREDLSVRFPAADPLRWKQQVAMSNVFTNSKAAAGE